MTRSATRRISLAAGIAWLVVGGTGILDGLVDYGDGWETPYTVFMLALAVAATLSIALGAEATRDCARPRLRMAGLAVSALGAVASFAVAWALPLWMTILGAGFALLAAAADPAPRRPLALLAAGQFAAIAVLIMGITAEVGRVDSYGDYPLAGGIALLVVAGTAMAAVMTLTFDRREATATTATA